MTAAPTPSQPSPGAARLDAATEALRRQVEEKRKTDPLIGAKIASREITQRLLHAMKDSRGVHAESLLTALGALAGYATQAAAREFGRADGKPDTAVFAIVRGADGQRYFFGELGNQMLLEQPTSVWKLASATAAELGAGSLPDIAELIKHTAESVGSPQFGVPRIPDGHKPGDTPRNYLAMWPKLLPTLQLFCASPIEWPIAYTLAVRDIMTQARPTLEPKLALTIVMEAAVPMAKVELAANGA